MYPDWPALDADLVPLPLCDGPKLHAFDFQGPQQMDFLEYLGQDPHAFALKVKIRGRIYALKLFRFISIDFLVPTPDCLNLEDPTAMSALYNYSDTFNCECRAYGRLAEAGHEDLALRCFGYVLLDEVHEKALMKTYADKINSFNGDLYNCGLYDQRSQFPGRDGRPPPLRGILKEMGYGGEAIDLRPSAVRRIVRDVVRILNGKLADFSTAITVPHFMTTPELNPLLTPAWTRIMVYDMFQLSIKDYLCIDEMVYTWNDECTDKGEDHKKFSTFVFPAGEGCRVPYNLRSRASRDNVFTFVDPRRLLAQRERAHGKQQGRAGIGKRRWRLEARPPLWHCEHWADKPRDRIYIPGLSVSWMYHDGLIFPCRGSDDFDYEQWKEVEKEPNGCVS